VAFSPVASIGVKDTYQKTYAVVYTHAQVNVNVYDSNGLLVKTLVGGSGGTPAILSAGQSNLSWDGRSTLGSRQPDGLYRVRIDQRNTTNLNQSQQETINLEIDNTTPTVTLSHLQASPYNPRLFSVWGNVNDRNIESVTLYRVSGSSVVAVLTNTSPSPETGSNGQAPPVNLGTVDATGWPSGNYFIRLGGTDSAGNTRITAGDGATAPPGSAVGPSNSLALTLTTTARPAVHVNAEITSQEIGNEGGNTQPADYPNAFMDDDLPPGADEAGNWEWSTTAYSGQRSHRLSANGPMTPPENRAHGFIHANPGYAIALGENLIQYIYRDASVREILIQYYTGQGDGEHRESRHSREGGNPGLAFSLVKFGMA
jgi:hypothetical protein